MCRGREKKTGYRNENVIKTVTFLFNLKMVKGFPNLEIPLDSMVVRRHEKGITSSKPTYS